MISSESKLQVKEIIIFCKKDTRFSWVADELICNIKRDRIRRKRIMGSANFEGYRIPGIIEEFNFNISIMCIDSKLKIQKYQHDSIVELIAKKLNYFTHKNGTINEACMVELYRWADDNRIANKIVEVEHYSHGRISKYSKKVN